MRFVPCPWDDSVKRRIILWKIIDDAHDALFSYTHVRLKNPSLIKNVLGIPEEARLWIDSSGFQIGNKHSPKLDVFSVYDFQRHCAHVAFTLDVPGNVEQTYQNAILGLAYGRGFDERPKIYAVATHEGDFGNVALLVRKYERKEFDGIAIGTMIPYGVANLESFAKMLTVVKKYSTKPVHVLGVGGYDTLYLMSMIGVESFDSSKFLGGAKWREYHLPQGGMAYLGTHYSSKHPRRRVLSGELPCSCPVCIDVKQVEYFQRPKAESVAHLALHNYYVMKNELKLIEIAKKEGWFESLIESRARKSARLRTAVSAVKKSMRTKLFLNEPPL